MNNLYAESRRIHLNHDEFVNEIEKITKNDLINISICVEQYDLDSFGIDIKPSLPKDYETLDNNVDLFNNIVNNLREFLKKLGKLDFIKSTNLSYTYAKMKDGNYDGKDTIKIGNTYFKSVPVEFEFLTLDFDTKFAVTI